MEAHFSQRLILGEWSWSLHRAIENDATVAGYKSKNWTKNTIKSTQPVSATKTDRMTKRREPLLQQMFSLT